MVRVLHIVTKMDRAGLETFLMNVYRNIDRKQVQFDFLTHRSEEGAYDREILSLGGRIYHVTYFNPLNPKYYAQLYSVLKRLYSENHIVHSHIDALSFIPLFLAKCIGYKIRIAHSHTSSFDKDWKFLIRYVLSLLIPFVATHLFACSRDAGRYVFGKFSKFSVIKNGIEVERFRFNPCVRNIIREKLGFDNKKVIIHVARVFPPKNQFFIIKNLCEKGHYSHDVLFLFVGDGPKKEFFEKYCVNKGLSEKVRFLGARADIPQLMQAADVFVFPSLFEGLGIAIIEAQSAGLPCVISDSIPKDCFITQLVKGISLKEPTDWVRAIDSAYESNRGIYASKVIEAGFDIRNTALWMQRFYLEMDPS